MHSLTSALDGGEWSAARPGRFTLRERAPGAHWIGCWVSFRTVLDAMVKRKIPSPRRESNPRIQLFQPVARAVPTELSRTCEKYKLVPRSTDDKFIYDSR
jgi:hypothetical protein